MDRGLWPSRIRAAKPWVATGEVVQVVGLTIRTEGPNVPIGELCWIVGESGRLVTAEVVGFHHHETWLMPLDPVSGLRPGTMVRASGHPLTVPVGLGTLGRLLDGIGRPRDGGPPVSGVTRPVGMPARSPLDRRGIERPLWTGIRVVDAYLTLGGGQRIGIFAGSGVGKTTLLRMLVTGVRADVVVVGLIGERGREVQEFWESLGDVERTRTVVVASTSEEPPLLRVRAAETATAIAEGFQEQGLDVLLVLDSLTRVAMAQREVGTASGEPPTSRGYTPSVFTLLPRLLERAGRYQAGSITGCYTVLVDGDDLEADPVADAVRGILDGHWVLSRERAEAGLYPAIDVPKSLSRTMDKVVTSEHREASAQARYWIARAARTKDLVELGAYSRGSDPETDAALAVAPRLDAWGRQAPEQWEDPSATIAALSDLTREVLT